MEKSALDLAREQARPILAKYITNKGSANSWYTNISDDISFNTPGMQWTTAQIRDLESRGQAALEIPIISPQIELQKSQIIAKPPQFKIVGRTDDDVKTAKAFSEICHYVWYKNSAEVATDEVVDNMLECGKGYYYIWWDQYGDDGYGLIRIDSLHPLDVVPDPNSRRRDEEDSDQIFIFKKISADLAKRLFPQHVEWIDELVPGDDERKFHRSGQGDEMAVKIMDEVIDETKKRILFLEQYSKIMQKYYVVNYNDGQNTISRELEEGEFEIFKSQINEQDIVSITNVVPQYRERVKKICILGDAVIYEMILPTSYYPIIPIPYRHRGNPYTYSLTRKMKSLQLETNFRRSLMIAHATASTNLKTWVPRGTADISELEQNIARPNFVGEYDPALGPPIQQGPVALPNALYELERLAKEDARYVAGPSGVSFGEAQYSNQPVRTTAMLDEFGNRRTSLVAKSLYYGLNKLGRIVVDFIQGYMTVPRILRIVNPYEQYDNEPIKIALNTVYDEQTIISIKDVSVGRYDVAVIIGSMAPSNRYAEMEMYAQHYQMGLIDRVEALRKTDIYDREGILKRMDELGQALEQGKRLAIQNQELQKNLGEVMDQLRNAKLNVERAQADKMYDRRELELKDQYNQKLLELDKLIQQYTLLIQEKQPEKKGD